MATARLCEDVDSRYNPARSRVCRFFDHVCPPRRPPPASSRMALGHRAPGNKSQNTVDGGNFQEQRQDVVVLHMQRSQVETREGAQVPPLLSMCPSAFPALDSGRAVNLPSASRLQPCSSWHKNNWHVLTALSCLTTWTVKEPFSSNRLYRYVAWIQAYLVQTIPTARRRISQPRAPVSKNRNTRCRRRCPPPTPPAPQRFAAVSRDPASRRRERALRAPPPAVAGGHADRAPPRCRLVEAPAGQ